MNLIKSDRIDVKSWDSLADKDTKFISNPSVFNSSFRKSRIEGSYVHSSNINECDIFHSQVIGSKLYKVKLGIKCFIKGVTLKRITLPPLTFVYHDCINLVKEYRYPIPGLKGYHLLYLTELKTPAIQVKIDNNMFIFTRYPKGIVPNRDLAVLMLMDVLANDSP